MNDINEMNQTLLSSLEKRGLLEMTKAYFRTSLLETLKKDNFYNTAPSGFNINSNINMIKDKNTIDIIRIQFSLINDFLIRTKMSYTQNIFINEIKTLLDSPIPLSDSELIHNLNLSTKQISTLRLNSNINSSPKDLVKSTYLYQLINYHCNLIKNDVGTQTMQSPQLKLKKNIDIEEEMKKIDEKYNKKLNLEEILPYNKNNEKKFLEYKEECDKKYEENLKNEIERFKNIELCNMRLEENEKYRKEIESIREEYEKIYEKKYDEIKKMRNILKEKESNLEKEYEKKMFDLNEEIQEKIKNLREENSRNNKGFIDEINNLNNEKRNLEQIIENLKDMHYNEMQAQLQKIKNDYQTQLESEKSILKEENERNQKILINNFTKNNKELSQIKKQIDNIQNIDKNVNINVNSINNRELGAIKNKNINNINNISVLKNSEILKNIADENKKIKKNMEDLEEEELRINKLLRNEFRNIMNEETPIVHINQDEIDQIKRNDYYYNNIIMNEKKEVQRKKSQDENLYNNYNNKDISPYKNNKQNVNISTSPFGKNNINNSKYMNNNSMLNNSKNINTSMRNSNMGIPGANYNNNINNMNKMSGQIIEEIIDNENMSSSQKSKEYSNKKSGSFNNYNNINNNNYNNIQRNSLATKLPPINNPNQTSSIKEDIEGSTNSKNKSKIGTASKKSNDNNIINKSNNKFTNINYGDKDDDDYGDGDFENNISSLNQNSVMNSTKKQVNNFGKIKNQNEASMSIHEEIEKHNRLGYDKESSESYNDFENTKGLIKKGINFEGSGNFNNMSKFKGNKVNTQESEIKEEIENYE